MTATIPALLDRAGQRFADRAFLYPRGDSGPSGALEDDRAQGAPRTVTRTFGQFVGDVQRASEVLRAAGVQPGERVAVLLPRGGEVAAVLLAVMHAGCVAVPMHAKLKSDQIAHVLADCAPRLVVTSALRTVALADVDELMRGVTTLDVAEVLGAAPAGTAAPAGPAAQPDNAAVLLYTSGSTGKAKGIVQTHRNLVRGAEIVSGYTELCESDHLLALLSFSFDYGLNQLLCALHAGAALTPVEYLGAGELAQLLLRHRPTGLAGVPSLWHEVRTALESGLMEDGHGESLRFVTNSGGALRPADSAGLRASWPHVAVFAMYGLTEAFRSAYLPPAELADYPDSFGYAIEGVELLLVDPDTGEVLADAAADSYADSYADTNAEATAETGRDVRGELVHAGELVASGYWQRPDAAAVRFRPDPRGGGKTVVYSGDLVRRDAQGRHYFVARLDRMLKVQGHRVSPDEVADAVRGLPGVVQTFVFGVDGGADGHRIVLCCVGASRPLAGQPDPADPGKRDERASQDAAQLAAIRRRCRSRLPSYMMPAHIALVSALPLNANGKVDVAELRRQVLPCTDKS
ncbi:MAG: AMP-binding protein [Planctomycetota bacterium]